MYEWKWSIGEPYYKSSKTNTKLPSTNPTVNLTNNTIFSALSSSDDPLYPTREELDTKIANRESFPQRGVNPFLQNSYINDVVNSERFLKPINTSTDSVKSHEHT